MGATMTTTTELRALLARVLARGSRHQDTCASILEGCDCGAFDLAKDIRAALARPDAEPVAAPSDAEIKAWQVRMADSVGQLVQQVRARANLNDWKAKDDEDEAMGCVFKGYRDAVSLMRRAQAPAAPGFTDGLLAALEHCKREVALCATPDKESGMACRMFDCLAQAVTDDFERKIKRGDFGNAPAAPSLVAAKVKEAKS
jgi:hypothetical protein